MAITWTKRASEIWRDYVTDGVPASGANQVYKPDVRAHLLQLEDEIDRQRVRLSADTTFYVHTSGTDSLTKGLSTGAGAFRTIQYAVNFVRDWVDANSYKIVVQVADGTWSEAVVLYDVMGLDHGGYLQRQLCIRGNVASPSSCVINSGVPCFKSINSQAGWVIEGFRMTGLGGVQADGNSFIYIGANQFQTTQYHVSATYRSIIEFVAGSSIGFSCGFPWLADFQSHIIVVSGSTFTLYNPAPAWANAFAYARHGSVIAAAGAVFSGMGAATGQRYFAAEGSAIDSGGGGANFFPGSVAGTSATGYYT